MRWSILQILSLRHNRLTGRLPPELGRLSQLVTLYMEKNELEGIIPETLANLAALEELNLTGNRFEGQNTKASCHGSSFLPHHFFFVLSGRWDVLSFPGLGIFVVVLGPSGDGWVMSR